MDQFFAGLLIAYIAVAAVAVPVIGALAAVAARDCRIVSGENCLWVIVPVSQAPDDQKPKGGE